MATTGTAARTVADASIPKNAAMVLIVYIPFNFLEVFRLISHGNKRTHASIFPDREHSKTAFGADVEELKIHGVRGGKLFPASEFVACKTCQGQDAFTKIQPILGLQFKQNQLHRLAINDLRGRCDASHFES